MDENDRRAGGVLRSDIEHVERRASYLDRFAVRGITMLKDDDAGLRRQRQHHKRGDEDHG